MSALSVVLAQVAAVLQGRAGSQEGGDASPDEPSSPVSSATASPDINSAAAAMGNKASGERQPQLPPPAAAPGIGPHSTPQPQPLHTQDMSSAQMTASNGQFAAGLPQPPVRDHETHKSGRPSSEILPEQAAQRAPVIRLRVPEKHLQQQSQVQSILLSALPLFLGQRYAQGTSPKGHFEGSVPSQLAPSILEGTCSWKSSAKSLQYTLAVKK